MISNLPHLECKLYEGRDLSYYLLTMWDEGEALDVHGRVGSSKGLEEKENRSSLLFIWNFKVQGLNRLWKEARNKAAVESTGWIIKNSVISIYQI